MASEAFESLVGRLDYPMFIVTTAVREERAGCLVGFATQTSIDPPRFLACISDKNLTFRVLSRADAAAVHLVPSDRGDLVELFGGETGDEADKFGRCSWRPGPGGLPLLDGCPAWFAGRIVERFELGDHGGFLLDPFDGSAAASRSDAAPGDWFPFSRAKRVEPGHEA